MTPTAAASAYRRRPRPARRPARPVAPPGPEDPAGDRYAVPEPR
ncbi:hypothetical protein [Streptomyces pilosus]|nr:hypothetical protein [Streptomyces pilosus]